MKKTLVHIYKHRLAWTAPTGLRKTFANNPAGKSLLVNAIELYLPLAGLTIHYVDHRR